ncbi:SOS response-associated peptidase [Polaribacter gangjinensis]|uniref:SOS response-associated peptidase n=1 Tax=Polaribacter gangjinensis TaxID=574710 RepID=UPI00374382B9
MEFKGSLHHHVKQTSTPKAMSQRFDAEIASGSLFVPQEQLNGFSFPLLPVITQQDPSLIQSFAWGLIPGWAKNEDIKKMTLNAKIETLHEKPAFKDVLTQRCLVIANGFYEWQWLDSKGKNKVKYEIGLENEALFAFAGLYSHWVDAHTGTLKSTCTIITTAANELMASIHNIKKRMPVILQPKDEQAWLHQASITGFAYPYQVPLVAKAMNEHYRLF